MDSHCRPRRWHRQRIRGSRLRRSRIGFTEHFDPDDAGHYNHDSAEPGEYSFEFHIQLDDTIRSDRHNPVDAAAVRTSTKRACDEIDDDRAFADDRHAGTDYLESSRGAGW
ncbi:hypothetical protein FOS14_11250 [Skermania sp. ID1734]|uniref:hypothetical protein n=1 Tax=Skermania sp. ID1734 TaxID=2597516 RepID=UPI00117C2FE1|nr:hypothetical protein [Skermania sp. ID1734]TSD99813.1 hypothetical protein FOS14_11250 [Skermania sp. ID1734]